MCIALKIIEDIGFVRMKMHFKIRHSLLSILLLYFLCRKSTTRFSGICLDQSGGWWTGACSIQERCLHSLASMFHWAMFCWSYLLRIEIVLIQNQWNFFLSRKQQYQVHGMRCYLFYTCWLCCLYHKQILCWSQKLLLMDTSQRWQKVGLPHINYN